jgi:hypothetical protein
VFDDLLFNSNFFAPSFIASGAYVLNSFFAVVTVKICIVVNVCFLLLVFVNIDYRTQKYTFF